MANQYQTITLKAINKPTSESAKHNFPHLNYAELRLVKNELNRLTALLEDSEFKRQETLTHNGELTAKLRKKEFELLDLQKRINKQ